MHTNHGRGYTHLHHGRFEVRVHPLVRDVPSHRTELPSLQDERVEEHEGKAKLLESPAGGARLVLLFLNFCREGFENAAKYRGKGGRVRSVFCWGVCKIATNMSGPGGVRLVSVPRLG